MKNGVLRPVCPRCLQISDLLGVVCECEFGRTPMMQARTGKNFLGRDHHNEAFTIWMVGAKIKKGITHGASYEIGYFEIKGKIHVHDIQTTILKQLGLDHERLTYRFQGRDFRLTVVHGNVIKEIFEVP